MSEKDLDQNAEWADDPDLEELCDDDLEEVAGGWTGNGGDGSGGSGG
ncbi:MAG: hypothetical protein AAGE94_04145 [Acidobacteriota bacterium]